MMRNTVARSCIAGLLGALLASASGAGEPSRASTAFESHGTLRVSTAGSALPYGGRLSVSPSMLVLASAYADDPSVLVAANGTLRTPESYHKHPFWLTVFDIFVVNEVIWLFNRYIREGGENRGFRKGWNTLTNNLKNGFEWDDNNFATNHFLHPYHGSLYFTGARSQGYSFWNSVPFAFAGSWLWEYWGEAHQPSVNDWINTSVGGMALGEGLHRMSNLVLDNTDTGNSRTWRELGGFLVAPVRGFNRLITGEAFEVHQNPVDRYPSGMNANFSLGLRTLGQENLWTDSETRAFMRFFAKYGDPFEDVGGKPFDAMDFGIQIHFDSPEVIGRIRATGILGSTEVGSSENAQHVLAAEQHFDYYENSAFKLGTQSFSATFLSKYLTKNGFETRATVIANGVILGASESDYFNVSGREYDYGPGLGFKVQGTFGRNGRTYLSIGTEQFWIHAINGNEADHYVSLYGVSADVPLRGFFGIKLEYLLYLSERIYAKFPDVSTRAPELRAYFSWSVG